MPNTHDRQRLLHKAADKLLAAAKMERNYTCGVVADDLLERLRDVDGDRMISAPAGRGRNKKIAVERYVESALKPLMAVEGSSLFKGVEDDSWAEDLLSKLAFYDEIAEYYFHTADEGDAVALDRNAPEWRTVSRRNVTIPNGLAYEVGVVLERLAEADPPVTISFSGFIEVAVRELLAKRMNHADVRKASDSTTQPLDHRTIADIIAQHEIGARRKAAAK